MAPPEVMTAGTWYIIPVSCPTGIGDGRALFQNVNL